MMDDETLIESEIATLIYMIGCGEWANFTYSIDGNTITASANVPDSWVNCQIDPAPPQFWNRLPLTRLSKGDYVLNLTLIEANQNINTLQMSFSIMGAAPKVSAYNKASLIYLILLIFTVTLFRYRPSSD